MEEPKMRSPGFAFVLAVAAGLSLGSRASAESPELSRMILTEKKAILLAPAETVAGWSVERAAWSPSGQYVLASRTQFPLSPPMQEPPEFQQSLVLWDGQAHKSSELWKVKLAPTQGPQFDWLTAGDVAFALAQYRPPQPANPRTPQAPAERRQWLLRIDARRGSMKPLFSVPESATLHVSPREPVTVVFSDSERLVRVLRADGGLLRQCPFPAGVSLGLPRWSSDGTRFLTTSYVVREEKLPQGLAQEAADYALDLRSGQLMRQASRERPQDPPAASAAMGDLRLKRGRAVLQEGAAHKPIAPLWLEAAEREPTSRALIAPDADWAELSPRGDAALYLSGGSAFVVPFISIPRELYLQAREAAQRQVVLSNGKQLGLAALIYAQEHDERLPGADQPVPDLLRQYAKADALYEGFVYTFPGGKLSEIAEPSQTVLGYVMGPGGRAEIYVDGHVVWKKD
jgi:hypothetical protein